MKGTPDQPLKLIAPATDKALHPGNITRRIMVAGTAATTALIAIDAQGQGADPNLRSDMVAFVLLSGALTGIAETKLAPGFTPSPPAPQPPAPPVAVAIDLQKSNFGSDPVNIKQEYFNWVRKERPKLFGSMLGIVKELAGKTLSPTDRAQEIINKVQEKPDTKYLARSIVLMWYLGAWYDPDNLRVLAEQPNPPRQASRFRVISSKAYTQAWALRVAQAHPMGFSELQFGYWTHEPQGIESFIGKTIA